jgi:hypothetical protein
MLAGHPLVGQHPDERDFFSLLALWSTPPCSTVVSIRIHRQIEGREE